MRNLRPPRLCLWSLVSLAWCTPTSAQCALQWMPANGIAVVVHGFGSWSVPLPSILPQGVLGCWSLVSPAVLDVLVPTGGTVATVLPIPDDVALAGLRLFQQVAPFELDLAGDLTAVTSTNALTLTIGSF